MRILAVDTSLPMLSVALLDGASTIGAISMTGKGSRNEKLLPAIDWLLSESGVDRSEVDLFAVTRGPGSFTGVRIGLATVQGLALVLARPVCAMSTHEAIALGDSALPAAEVVIDDAGRGEFYASEVTAPGRIGVPRLLSAADSQRLIDQGRRVLRASEFIERHNVALCCGRRALEIFEQGEQERYSDPTPIYVRLAEAEVTLQQRKG
ncbi:MAG TPA: tRNA (adenosine(37)-N6)-threonylcarbamoyltransferase complex dimerization subunit type 1 TsaB [Thermoanaerobaculia bacterium]|nr:tRNA (adenosine(37)-N6)-threonylcarbamoyltransferase complex dimerization subunit type 1 TsaB [Thermoanaerobaculia bacterium]